MGKKLGNDLQLHVIDSFKLVKNTLGHSSLSLCAFDNAVESPIWTIEKKANCFIYVRDQYLGRLE